MATNFQATTSLGALIAMSMCIALLSQTTVAFNDIFPRGRRLLDPLPQLMPFPYPPREGWGGFQPFPFPPIGGGGSLPFPFPPIGGGGGGRLPFPFPPIGGGGGRLPFPFPPIGGGGALPFPFPPIGGGGGGLPFPLPPIGGGGKPLPFPLPQCSNTFFAFLFPFLCHKTADSPGIAPASDSNGNAASPLSDSPAESPAYGYEEAASELKTPSTDILKCLSDIIKVQGCVEDIQNAIFGGKTIGKDCCKAIDVTTKRHALSNDCLSKVYAGFDHSVPQYFKSICAPS